MTKRKENLGLAGEYFITSELLLRDFYAQPTFGKMKKMDLLIINLEKEESSLKIIEVKASQEQKKFPMVKGIPLKPNYLIIFLDYENKLPNEKPDIYILNSNDWFNFIKIRITEIVDNWKTRKPPEKRKGKIRGPNDRSIWIYTRPNCILQEIKENEKIKYFMEDSNSNTSIKIASIKESEGKVKWKNPKGATGIDVPIRLIKNYKVEYDKEWEKLF